MSRGITSSTVWAASAVKAASQLPLRRVPCDFIDGDGPAGAETADRAFWQRTRHGREEAELAGFRLDEHAVDDLGRGSVAVIAEDFRAAVVGVDHARVDRAALHHPLDTGKGDIAHAEAGGGKAGVHEAVGVILAGRVHAVHERDLRGGEQLRIGLLAELLAIEGAVEVHEVAVIVLLALCGIRPLLDLPLVVDEQRRELLQHGLPAREAILPPLRRGDAHRAVAGHQLCRFRGNDVFIRSKVGRNRSHAQQRKGDSAFYLHGSGVRGRH